MRFYGLFYVANQKARKAIDNVRIILNKIHFIFVYGNFTVPFPLIYSQHLTILGLVIVKNKLTSVFLCICPPTDDKFRHNIVKVYCRTTLTLL